VSLQGSNAKTLLVIKEEVDLGREEVTMIHEWVYARDLEWVSGITDDFQTNSWNKYGREAPHIWRAKHGHSGGWHLCPIPPSSSVRARA
jgi:hypothetical protein